MVENSRVAGRRRKIDGRPAAREDHGMDRASNLTNGTRTAIRGIHGDPMRASPPRDGVRMTRIFATAAVLCLLGLSAQGCHGDSSQQQFMNALNRGNGAQASQLWLKMSAKDRSNFSHNIGFKNTVDKDDVGRALLKHQQEEAKRNSDDPDNMMTASDNGDTDSQQVEVPGIPVGGLSNLPLFNTQPSAPITEIGPQ
jgi:hypothetical protein